MTVATKTVPASTGELATQIARVQELADKYALDVLQTKGHIEQAILVADGVQALKQAIRPLMPKLTALMNTKLGFDTDRNPTKPSKGGAKEPYPAEVVENCLVEALMRGFHVVGNHFNIIAGNVMGVQQGWKYLVQHKIPGLTDLDTYISPPTVIAGQLTCRCRASWKLNGLANHLKDSQGRPGAVYAVKIFDGQGADAAIGKAERRMWKAVYELCVGSIWTESDAEVQQLSSAAEPDAAKTQTQALLETVQQKKPGAQPAADHTGLVSEEQLKKIAQLQHVVEAEEFGLMIEKYGVFQVGQLSAKDGQDFIDRLTKIHEGKQ